MIKFKTYKLETKNKNIYFTGRIKDLKESSLFDTIERLAGTNEAITATSWAEIAYIGETYEHELFTLTIVD